MTYKIGDKITTKKPHACGANEWEVARVGADIKLKCVQCGRCVFLSSDQVDRIKKSHTPKEESNDEN